MRGASTRPSFLVTMVIMGLVGSWWALLAAAGRGADRRSRSPGPGSAATTFMRSWIDFDFVNLALIPMFLFSATFFPLSQYPEGLQWVMRCTPLYQGVALERALATRRLDLDHAPERRLPRGHGHGRPLGGQPPPQPPPAPLTRATLGR